MQPFDLLFTSEETRQLERQEKRKKDGSVSVEMPLEANVGEDGRRYRLPTAGEEGRDSDRFASDQEYGAPDPLTSAWPDWGRGIQFRCQQMLERLICLQSLLRPSERKGKSHPGLIIGFLQIIGCQQTCCDTNRGF